MNGNANPRRWPIVVALAALNLLLLGLAVVLVALSVHGPDSLPTAVAAWLGAGTAVLWLIAWLLRRRHARTVLGAACLTSAALLACGVALVPLSARYDARVIEARIAATVVSRLTDEPLLAQGRPLGVRLSFEVRVPARDWYVLYPFLRPVPAYFERMPLAKLPRGIDTAPLDLRVAQRSVDPAPPDEPPADPALEIPTSGLTLEPGRAYRFRFDLLPTYLRRRDGRHVGVDPGNLCIAWPDARSWSGGREAFEILVGDHGSTPYEVMVLGTRFGDAAAGPSPPTGHAYVPGEFLRSARELALPDCDPSLPVVY